MGKRPELGEVVVAYLREWAAAFAELDAPVRSGEDDSIHQMRVAARRLRSALRSYRSVFKRAPVEALATELKWIGGILGAARDAEVLRIRLRAELAIPAAELMLGPVAARVDSETAERCRRATRQLEQALGSRRYLRLLHRLDSFVTNPPTTPKARRPAAKRLKKVISREQKRVRRLAARASTIGDEGPRDRRLHDVRKAAKRARYAADLATAEVGKPAARMARRMEDVQEVLGEHHDSVAARAALLDAGVAAYLAGESAFTFGLLHAAEAARGAEALRAYADLSDY